MSYINDIFERSNIRQLRGFLMYGHRTDTPEIDNYMERLDFAHEKYKEAVSMYDDINEDSILFTSMKELLTEYEEIYMEIGMLAGIYKTKNMHEKLKNLDSILIPFQENEDCIYKEMYISLFNDVIDAIELLQKRKKGPIMMPIKLLQEIQSKAEDRYIKLKKCEDYKKYQ